MKKTVFVLITLATGALHKTITAYTWKVTNNIDAGNPNVDGGYGFRLRIGSAGPGGSDIARVVSKGDTNEFHGDGIRSGLCLIHVDYQKKIGDNSTWERVPYEGGAANWCGDGHIIVERKDSKIQWHFITGYTMTIVNNLGRGIGIRLNFSGDHRTATLDKDATVQLHGGLGLCLTALEYMEADVWSQPGASDKKSNWKNLPWAKIEKVIAPVAGAIGGGAGGIGAGVGITAGAEIATTDAALAAAAEGTMAVATTSAITAAAAPIVVGAGIVAAAAGIGLGAYVLSELCRDRTIKIFDDGNGPVWDFR